MIQTGTFQFCGLVLVVMLGFCVSANAAPSLLSDGTLVAGRCDRACMMSLVDDYLLATVAHDPKKILWATLPKYTENGVVIEPGLGVLWQTTTAIGKYKNYFVDLKGGQVGFLGVIYLRDNNGTANSEAPMLIGMRLKVAGRRISEAEVLMGDRPGAGAAAEASGSPPVIFQQPIMKHQQASREQLINAADAYFTGLEQINGDMVPFAKTCNRVENGGQTTNLKDLSQAPGIASDQSWRIHFVKGCREQLNSGMFAYITELRNRRYEVIDEEKGNILSFVIFAHPGGIKKIQLPGQAVINMPENSTRPFDTYVAEAFHIRGGLIHQIEAVIMGGKLGMDSGWPDRARVDR